jgi:hypothetical protein
MKPPVVVPPVASPTVPDVNLQIIDIQNRKVVTNKDANLWDLHFTTWAGAKSVKVIPKGTEVEVSATAKHPLGGIYYLSEYSYSKGIMNGINSADVSEIAVKPVDPPVVVPPTPVVPPVVPPVTPPVTPPIDPNLPTDGEDALTWLRRVLAWITGLLSKFTFKK